MGISKCRIYYAGVLRAKNAGYSLPWYNDVGMVDNGDLGSMNQNVDLFVIGASCVCNLAIRIASIGVADAYTLSLKRSSEKVEGKINAIAWLTASKSRPYNKFSSSDAEYNK
jgi:hypothetical protein